MEKEKEHGKKIEKGKNGKRGCQVRVEETKVEKKKVLCKCQRGMWKEKKTRKRKYKMKKRVEKQSVR